MDDPFLSRGAHVVLIGAWLVLFSLPVLLVKGAKRDPKRLAILYATFGVYVVALYGFAPQRLYKDALAQAMKALTDPAETKEGFTTFVNVAYGAWSVAYAAIILVDGKGQKFRAWPFALASIVLGAWMFVLYLALRDPDAKVDGRERSKLLWVIDTPLPGVYAMASALMGTYQAAALGDWARFSEVMSKDLYVFGSALDGFIFWAIAPLMVRMDLAHRGVAKRTWVWIATGVPIFGVSLYMLFKPRFPRASPVPAAA